VLDLAGRGRKAHLFVSAGRVALQCAVRGAGSR
jgi:hypothetical protein